MVRSISLLRIENVIPFSSCRIYIHLLSLLKKDSKLILTSTGVLVKMLVAVTPALDVCAILYLLNIFKQEKYVKLLIDNCEVICEFRLSAVNVYCKQDSIDHLSVHGRCYIAQNVLDCIIPGSIFYVSSIIISLMCKI